MINEPRLAPELLETNSALALDLKQSTQLSFMCIARIICDNHKIHWTQ